ncbi:hypothetical protein BJV74DRAFT_797431 [Russula compacta]|nr:hypothetical protein BJV74DRAFT_797431 [Russula compacta]
MSSGHLTQGEKMLAGADEKGMAMAGGSGQLSAREMGTMSQSQTPTTTSSSSNYQAIFDRALEAYKRKTNKDLHTVLATLREQIPGPYQSGDDRRTKWLGPTVNVLYNFSAVIGGGISLDVIIIVTKVYPPAGVIFTGIGILLSVSQTAAAVSASQDTLTDVFDRIENFLSRLEIYIKVRATAGMTEIIVKIMVEVLSILGIATKEIKQNIAKKYLKKLLGMNDMEDALGRLDRLTQEEARMAAAQGLEAIHEVMRKYRR